VVITVLAAFLAGCLTRAELAEQASDCEVEAEAASIESADCWPSRREVSGAFD